MKAYHSLFLASLLLLSSPFSANAASESREVEWNGELDALLEDGSEPTILPPIGIEGGLSALGSGDGHTLALDVGYPLMNEDSQRSLHLKLEVGMGAAAPSPEKEFRYRLLRAGLSSRAPIGNSDRNTLKGEILYTRADGLYGRSDTERSVLYLAVRLGIELRWGRWLPGVSAEWNFLSQGLISRANAQIRLGFLF